MRLAHLSPRHGGVEAVVEPQPGPYVIPERGHLGTVARADADERLAAQIERPQGHRDRRLVDRAGDDDSAHVGKGGTVALPQLGYAQVVDDAVDPPALGAFEDRLGQTRVARVGYAEIVSSLASRAAGPGTRANIDEFVDTTTRALVEVGGAARGKALIILNRADPPIRMRNTVLCAVPPDADQDAITSAVHDAVRAVQRYAPGYRLKEGPIFQPDGGPG